MIAAIIFSLSVVFALVLVLRAEMDIRWRAVLAATIALFAVVAYVLATRSEVSPFGSSTRKSFGYTDQLLPTCLAIVGAVGGVIGSYFFRLGNRTIRWRTLVPPLVTTPLVLVPTIKLVEASGEQTLLTLILLFALSYQNGFFWERLLKSPVK
jgi:hypothetical protein